MEIRLGNCCGSCIHSNRPKTPRDHAAHYEVAKTERWCFKHDCHITRESSCDDHEGVSRAAKTAFTRLIKYNARRKAILELAELMGNKPITTRDYIYFAKNNWPINKEIIESRSGLPYKSVLEDCIAMLEKMDNKHILDGLGELLTESQKDWARAKLKEDTTFLLKVMVDAIQ